MARHRAGRATADSLGSPRSPGAPLPRGRGGAAKQPFGIPEAPARPGIVAAAPRLGCHRADPPPVPRGRQGPVPALPAAAGPRAPASPRETAAGRGPASRQPRRPEHVPGGRRGACGRTPAQSRRGRPALRNRRRQRRDTTSRRYPPTRETSPLALTPRAPARFRFRGARARCLVKVAWGKQPARAWRSSATPPGRNCSAPA